MCYAHGITATSLAFGKLSSRQTYPYSETHALRCVAHISSVCQK